jgi:UDP-N-acetylglucosamine/UDP-N-acetyl-alpha-D-glucosaminouronate 4-epimerase
MSAGGASVLVTGGAGFIGSHLAERLCREGRRVRVLDNLATGRLENLEAVRDELELIDGDIRDPEISVAAVRGCEVVFHEAALPSVPRSVRDPQASHAANATGTVNVLVACRDEGVRRVVFASSSSVYGSNPKLPKEEEMATMPIAPYAVGKLAAEGYCRAFFEVYGLETVSLRYFNVFGPRQDPASEYAAVIPRFITAVLAGERPVVYGDGEQSRDFTYVDNAVDANLLAADATGVAGRTFNIAGGERISLNEVLRELGRITGRETEALHEEPRVGDVRHSQADISRAREALGYDPAVSVREGLARVTAHLERELSSSASFGSSPG